MAVTVVAAVVALATLPGYGLLAQLVVNTGLAAVGTLIVRRRPGNVVGLLALANGSLIVVNVTLVQLGLRFAERGALDEAGAVVLVSAVLFPLSAGVQVPLFLAFPDRSTPTPAARWYLTVWGFVVVVQTVVALLGRPAMVVDPEWELPHPFVGPELADRFLALADGLLLVTVALMLGTIPVLVRRWRRGGPVERRQIGWLGLAFATYTVVAGVNTARQPSGAVGGETFLLIDALGGSAIPIALAVAILRFRLYDIDVIVSKTVMFLGLAGAITVVYAIVIAGSIAVVGAPGDGLGVVPPIVATAVVAVVFEPVRVRMQRWANRLVFGERATRHEVLSQTSAALAEATSGGADELAALLALGTGADEARLWVRDADGYRTVGSHPAAPEPVRIESLPEQSDVADRRTIEHGGTVLGAVTIVKPRNDPVSPSDADILDDVAAGAALLLRRIRLTGELEQRLDEVRRSRRRLLAAQDAERQRLERDLHDGAQQRVVALNVKLGIARTLAERGGHNELAAVIDGLAVDAQQSVADLRTVAHGIYPPLLATGGLAAALGALHSPIPVDLRATGLGRYDAEVEQAIYFAIVEILDRLRLAGGSKSSVVVVADDDTHGSITASVTSALPGSAPELAAIGDRLDAIGGSLTVTDRGGEVRIEVVAPTRPAVAA